MTDFHISNGKCLDFGESPNLFSQQFLRPQPDPSPRGVGRGRGLLRWLTQHRLAGGRHEARGVGSDGRSNRLFIRPYISTNTTRYILRCFESEYHLICNLIRLTLSVFFPLFLCLFYVYFFVDFLFLCLCLFLLNSLYWRDFATLGKLCDLPWPYLIAHHMGENFPLVDCI